MASRFQHLFLVTLLGLVASLFAVSSYAQNRPRLDNEYFELGIDLGVLAIQDFNSEWAPGINATFHASEDFFLQLNLFTAEASLSSFERSQRPYFEGDDRNFIQYGLLVGYNVFAGELYLSEGRSSLSNLYFVVGAGNISFGGEERFGSTLGFGYKLGLTRRLNLRIDFKDHIYESNLIEQGDASHNTRFSVGLGFLF